MKIVCKKGELVKNLQMALLSLSPKTMLPHLSFLLMEAEENEVSITSTDLEVSTKIRFEADVEKSGQILIHGDLFNALTRAQEEKDITIEEDSDNIKIKCGKFRATVAKGNLGDYPQIPIPPKEKDNFVKVSAFHLQEMLNKTFFAASKDDVRYVLCSVYFGVSKGKLTLAATDGKRLSTTSREVSTAKSVKLGAIVPAKTINILHKVLSTCDENEEFTVTIVENSIFFSSAKVMMSSRLIDGTYPDFKNVIPKTSKIKVVTNKEELLKATVRASSIFQVGISAVTNAVKYQLKKEKLVISASSSGFGECEDEVEVESSGGTLNISFNPVFVIDILKHLESEKVVMEFTDSLNAAVFKTPSDESFLSLIMPMRQ
ncbi:MAG: DNA polymerase III subunit beta [Elusimicrobia bacterium]|nr:DNA polymerase III subunit beta [Elusimicrobiota bacterium]